MVPRLGEAPEGGDPPHFAPHFQTTPAPCIAFVSLTVSLTR